ncbi:MAG TPA: mechanosensitive ion channel [Tissierellales bacterium]|nr:mechanosensitive ion channel [Tissierellales bacterium]
METFLTELSLAVPSIIYAIVLLVIAFLVAGFSKSLAVKLLKKLNLDKYTDKLGVVDETTGSSLEFVGNLVYAIVFLLFLPAVLNRLGMQGVSSPIEMFVSKFLNFLPNLIGAIIILSIGIFLAKLIRQIITPILKRLNVDRLQEKAGVTTSDSVTISSMISYVIYVLIIIMSITAALQALNISAISNPAISMLDRIFNAIPKLFVAIAIVIIGNTIAKMAGKLLENILSSAGTDHLINKLIPSDNEKIKNISLSKIVGKIVKYIIVILFVVEAFSFLNFHVLKSVGEGIISYLPYLISGILIMGIALFASAWIENIMIKKLSSSKFIALVVKSLIIMVAVFMTLSQLGFAKSIVNAAFIIILGALAIAFAISFGIGGREFASNILKGIENKVEEEKK